jgi:uncharacterized protein (TIGR03663 family)
MKRYVVIACWLGVLLAGAALRFDELSSPPFHFDEATGARITAKRMDPSGSYRFDPTHYHGPLLSSLSIPINRLRGEGTWPELTKGTLRLLPAIAGTLVVLVPLLWRRRWGDASMLLAAAFLATSPLLVYYSRMFIHEILLTLFGLITLVLLFTKPKFGIPGLVLGLMFATKETFVISVLAWSGAGAILLIENRRAITRERVVSVWNEYRIPVLVSILAAVVTAGFFYTDAFRRPEGAWDAVRTFFVYKTEAGHDKPFDYYLDLLVIPGKGGIWWFETPVLVLALVAWASTFGRSPEAAKSRPAIRFIAYSALGQFLIYSLFAYKTPWLVCLPWAHVCLLAGFSIGRFPAWRAPWKVAFSVLLALSLFSQYRQTRWATGRFASDVRCPYAYVPTSVDIESLEPWLIALGEDLPEGTMEPVAVIGSGYWPLPWYLRHVDRIGYWPEPPDDLARQPVVLAMPETVEEVTARLGDTHIAFPRGLRAEVPVYLFLRNDIWAHWMEED